MKQKNRVVGFWYRLFIILMDLIVALSLPIGFSVLVIKPNNTIDNLGYYLWSFSIIIWFFLYWVIIPFLFRGFTLFRWIFRTKLALKNNEESKLNLIWFIAILKNQTFTSLSWIVIVFLSMTLINPELAFRIASSTPGNNLVSNQNNQTQKLIDQALIAIPSTFSTFLVFLNFFIIITSGIRKDSLTIVEVFSKTKLIYLNKFEEKPNFKIENEKLIPVSYIKNKIIFINKNEEDIYEKK
ncbi:hypothetical protein [[Mycoplasma] mobile]|nr:hypothetical protein [[Mycoplasma] mobile]